MALRQVVMLLLVGICAALGMGTASVVQTCKKDTDTFLWEINQDKPKQYAVDMYDAFGKMGSNIEGGNANQPGLLQQCRSAHGPSFSGQYCQVFLRQGKVEYFVGICVPDSCAEEEVQQMVLQNKLQMDRMSLIPPLPSILVNDSTQEMFMTHCLSNTVYPDASDITCLSVFFPNLLVDSGATSTCWSQSCWNGFLQAFSLQNTSRNVLSMSSHIPGGGFSSVNGIRVLSLLWIICGHSAQFPVINNLDNYKNWKATVENSPFYVLSISGPVFLAVDTFLLLGGMLSSRSLLILLLINSEIFSVWWFVLMMLFYTCRIQPLHLFIMCLTIGLISLVQWGPYWFPFINTLMDCKTYWWANLFLISNLLPVHEICIPWTWYLSLDFQCYATTPVLVFFYRLTSEKYVLYYYVKPYTRYSPFLIGILIGIYLTTRKDQLLKSKWQAALGWFGALAVMAVVVGVAYILKDTPAYVSVPHSLYQGLHRPLWALSVAWIILACEEGYGGFIKEFLSMNVWVPLSNISFACYLIHPVFIILYIGLQDTPIHFTNINFMYLFLGHLVLTLVVSYVLNIERVLNAPEPRP
uniref:O-acyltransferase like protein-like n=1 Tax=Gouania willdenowi TaxID=441366 RepID=A0A8C5EYU3_GOUWI